MNVFLFFNFFHAAQFLNKIHKWMHAIRPNIGKLETDFRSIDWILLDVVRHQVWNREEFENDKRIVCSSSKSVHTFFWSGKIWKLSKIPALAKLIEYAIDTNIIARIL